MTCPACSAANVAGAAFCSNCGASLPNETSPQAHRPPPVWRRFWWVIAAVVVVAAVAVIATRSSGPPPGYAYATGMLTGFEAPIPVGYGIASSSQATSACPSLSGVRFSSCRDVNFSYTSSPSTHPGISWVEAVFQRPLSSAQAVSVLAEAAAQVDLPQVSIRVPGASTDGFIVSNTGSAQSGILVIAMTQHSVVMYAITLTGSGQPSSFIPMAKAMAGATHLP